MKFRSMRNAPKDGTPVWLINNVMRKAGRDPVKASFGDYRLASGRLVKSWRTDIGHLVMPDEWAPVEKEATT